MIDEILPDEEVENTDAEHDDSQAMPEGMPVKEGADGGGTVIPASPGIVSPDMPTVPPVGSDALVPDEGEDDGDADDDDGDEDDK